MAEKKTKSWCNSIKLAIQGRGRHNQSFNSSRKYLDLRFHIRKIFTFRIVPEYHNIFYVYNIFLLPTEKQNASKIKENKNQKRSFWWDTFSRQQHFSNWTFLEKRFFPIKLHSLHGACLRSIRVSGFATCMYSHH